MTKNKQLTLIALLVLIFFGCKKDGLNKYDRPTWLAGKLYTQIKSKPELKTFAELVKIAGYDTIIDVSGSYTVFAPSDDAFIKYFAENPNYKTVADMPVSEVVKLVKYHLVQNAWSKKQLTQLDIYGWIDTLDLKNNEPKGYKRETLLLGKNQKYGVAWSKYKKFGYPLIRRTNIVDTTQTNWTRRVYTDSRKFVPIFFKGYFDIYKLSYNSDYDFYFGRQFGSVTDLFYSGALITGDELFAENGFVYVIDRVEEPLKNGVEFLTDNSKGLSYKSYYNIVNMFSEFSENIAATNAQPGHALGLQVDTLFDLTYPQLVFNINSEKTNPPKGTYGLPANTTIRYHHGIVAPTDDAMNQLISQYIAGGNNWGSLEACPENIKRIIANSSLSINPIYPTDFTFPKGFLNGESDIIQVDPTTIVQQEYGSNCTFIGVNKPIIPRAFSSITGPVYTRKGFQKVMYAIEKSGLLSALKRREANYSFYVEPDGLSSIDSSFIYDPALEKFYVVTLGKNPKKSELTLTDLRILLLNHVGVDQPKGIAKKEFIRNMAGNYLIFDNVTKEVMGTAPSVYGYKGSKPVPIFPRQISTNADNGTTYEIDNWLQFSASDIFTTISTKYLKFHALLKRAFSIPNNLYHYSFLSDNQNYTVFAPTDAALNAIATTTAAMSIKQLQDFVLLHFIQGAIIFTDGNLAQGYYETARVDESSTKFVTFYTKIKIEPGIDQITIPAKDGTPIVVVNEESPKANQIMSRNLSTTGTEAYTNCISTSVVHEINNVLLYDVVDTQK